MGSAPGLILGGCHSPDEKEVFAELCDIVEEAIALYRADGKPLPPPTAGSDFANKMQDVVYSADQQSRFRMETLVMGTATGAGQTNRLVGPHLEHCQFRGASFNGDYLVRRGS